MGETTTKGGKITASQDRRLTVCVEFYGKNKLAELMGLKSSSAITNWQNGLNGMSRVNDKRLIQLEKDIELFGQAEADAMAKTDERNTTGGHTGHAVIESAPAYDASKPEPEPAQEGEADICPERWIMEIANEYHEFFKVQFDIKGLHVEGLKFKRPQPVKGVTI